MPGRWKMGPNGGFYDPNDSGPDQYTPNPGEMAGQQPAPQQAQAPEAVPADATTAMTAERWGGPLTIELGADGGYSWGSPGDQQKRIGMAQDLFKFLAGMGIGKPSVMPRDPSMEPKLIPNTPQPTGIGGMIRKRLPTDPMGGNIPQAGGAGIGTAMTGGLGALGRGGLMGGLFGR